MEEKKKDSVLDFVRDHKVEIGVALAMLVSYRLGYNKGYGDATRILDKGIDEFLKALDISKF